MTSEPWCPEPTPEGGWENSPGGGVTGHPPTESERWAAEVVALRERADEADELARLAYEANEGEKRLEADLEAALGREAKLREALVRLAHEVELIARAALAGADTPPPPDTPEPSGAPDQQPHPVVFMRGNALTVAPANNAGAGKETL